MNGTREPPRVVLAPIAGEGIGGTQPLLHRPGKEPLQTGSTTGSGGCRHIPNGQEGDDIVQTDLVKWSGQVLCGQGQVRAIGADGVGAGLPFQVSQEKSYHCGQCPCIFPGIRHLFPTLPSHRFGDTDALV
jgi:hypothetical protein